MLKYIVSCKYKPKLQALDSFSASLQWDTSDLYSVLQCTYRCQIIEESVKACTLSFSQICLFLHLFCSQTMLPLILCWLHSWTHFYFTTYINIQNVKELNWMLFWPHISKYNMCINHFIQASTFLLLLILFIKRVSKNVSQVMCSVTPVLYKMMSPCLWLIHFAIRLSLKLWSKWHPY